MVRVKHRYLVAQILYPEQPSAAARAADGRPQDRAGPSTTVDSTAPSTGPPSIPTTNPILEFHRPTPPEISTVHLVRLIRDTIAEIFGDAGAGLCGGSLAVKYFSPATSTLIVRCARERARMVWAALTMITHLPAVGEGGRYRAGVRGRPCVVRVVRNSGTIRKSEERIVELARQDILRIRAGGGESAFGNADMLERIMGRGMKVQLGQDGSDVVENVSEEEEAEGEDEELSTDDDHVSDRS